jgi:hypothetical protein
MAHNPVLLPAIQASSLLTARIALYAWKQRVSGQGSGSCSRVQTP